MIKTLLCGAALALLLHPAARADVTANIANAPGWQVSTQYATAGHLGNRVLSGAGWNPGSSTFNNGSALYLLEATTAGTSGSSQPTISSCPSTGISDGSVTWQCLTKVDYNTITGHWYDAPAYNTTSGTSYPMLSWVVSDSPPKVYRQMNLSITTCTTAGTAPTGTGSTSDGTCTWSYAVTLNYSSEANLIPKDVFTNGLSGPYTSLLTQYYVGLLWSGGIAQQEYLVGANGEMANGIVFEGVVDVEADNGGFGEGGVLNCQGTGGVLAFGCYGVIYEAAPGESFRDLPGIANLPLRYNPANGVAIHTTLPSSATTSNPCATSPACFSVPAGSNNFPVGNTISIEGAGVAGLFGLQIKSDNGSALGGLGSNGGIPGSAYRWLVNDILDCGGSTYCVNSDNLDVFADSLFICRETTALTACIANKYEPLFFNLTIVGNNPTGGTCIYMNDYNAGGGTLPNNDTVDSTMQNVLCIGFPHFLSIFSTYEANWTGALSSNNATASASGDSGSYTDPTFGNAATVIATNLLGISGSACGGSCFSLSPGAVLVNPTIGASLDARLQTGSPVIGAGASFSWNSTTTEFGTLNNALDIIKQTRPSGGGYNPGAEQVPYSSGGGPAGGGWRRHL